MSTVRECELAKFDAWQRAVGMLELTRDKGTCLGGEGMVPLTMACREGR